MNSYTVGLHLRITKTMHEILHEAIQLQLPFFQCFLLHQDNNKYITIADHDARIFAAQAQQQFNRLYIHASYWINLAHHRAINADKLLFAEMMLAKRLGFSHIILHPGVAVGVDKQTGIAMIAKKLNELMRNEHDLVLLLENAAGGGNTIGGNLQELAEIRNRLDQPEKVQFCIDTAHAHTFGYVLDSAQGLEKFITEIQSTITTEAIQLIHLNDTQEKFGSGKDRHALFGTGQLGEQVLMQCKMHPAFADIACLLELPPLSAQEQWHILERIESYIKNRSV